MGFDFSETKTRKQIKTLNDFTLIRKVKCSCSSLWQIMSRVPSEELLKGCRKNAKVLPARVPPAGVPQAGVPPAGVPPAGVPPAGVPQAGVPPAGVPPAGVPPAGVPPVGVPQAGVPPVGLRFRVAQGLGFRVEVSGLELSLKFWVWGLGLWFVVAV